MRAVSLFLCIAAPICGAGAQERICADPTPSQRNWWHLERNPHPDSATYSAAPVAPPIYLATGTAALIGRYDLELVQTLGGHRRLRGVLELDPLERADSAGDRVLRGFIETTDAALIGEQPVAIGSREVSQPGVEVYYGHDRRLSLWAGNPGLRWTDSGIGLEVFEATNVLIRGRWVDGAAITVVEAGHELGPPQGYFCAWHRED